MNTLKYIGSLEPHKPTILMLAGGMTNPAIFNNIARTLTVQHAQIDWLGSPGPWDSISVGQALYDFILEKNLGPTILIGYSASGPICLQAAMLDTDGQITGLVINNTGLNANNHGDPNGPQKILDTWGQVEHHQQFINRCFAFPVATDINTMLMNYILQMDKQAAYQASYQLRQIDLLPDANKVTCPVLLIHGILDKARTVEHALTMKQNLPNSMLYFLNGGHTIFVEAETEYLFLLNAFLKQLKFV